jgi:hypothetical protein
VAEPPDARGAPERDPAAGLTGEERARATARLVHRLLAGGIAFLVVVVLGMLPAALSSWWPEAGRAAAVAVWFVAPALGVALLVFAVARRRR